MIQQFLLTLGTECTKKLFFGLPPWYAYLKTEEGGAGGCNIQISGIYDLFRILAAVIEIALRLGVLIAVGFIIFGGIKFITSQGDPQGIANARNTIVNAIIGLIITLLATVIVSYVAGRF
jgi:hypothetical protein